MCKFDIDMKEWRIVTKPEKKEMSQHVYRSRRVFQNPRWLKECRLQLGPEPIPPVPSRSSRCQGRKPTVRNTEALRSHCWRVISLDDGLPRRVSTISKSKQPLYSPNGFDFSSTGHHPDQTRGHSLYTQTNQWVNKYFSFSCWASNNLF